MNISIKTVILANAMCIAKNKLAKRILGAQSILIQKIKK